MDETYDLIRRAILNRQHVLATYKGYYREMCPHVLGTKHDRQQGLFYQFAGESSSGLSPAGSLSNWRCIPIGDLREVTIRDGEWYTASNHSRQQTCVDGIDVEVEF